MPREFGQLRHDLWLDDDWLDLTPMAQWLYMTWLGDSKLSYASVAPFHLGKVAQRSRTLTGRDTFFAAAELSETFFIVVDEETEEVMLRSLLRHDPIMKNPRLAVTMTKDYGNIASRKIRAAAVHELTRLRKEQPDLGAWEKPQVKTLLRQNAVNPKEMETDLPIAAAVYLGVGLPVDVRNVEGAFTEALQLKRATGTATGTSSKEDPAPRSESYPHPVESALKSRDTASGSGVAS